MIYTPHGASIVGIGTSPGVRTLTLDHAISLASPLCATDARQERLLRAIYKGTGIPTRSVVLPEADGLPPFYRPEHNPTTEERMERFQVEAPPLAIDSIKQALNQAGWEPQTATHLVMVTCTGFQSPGLENSVIRGVGLSPAIERLHIGFMGCHGAINGMRAAASIAGAIPGARVLLCATEICSIHFQYGWNSELVTANALFADGSASLAISGEGRHPAPHILSTAGQLIPDTLDQMGWRIGPNGFVMNLSPKVPGILRDSVGQWVDDWLEKCGLDRGRIGSWAVHPGGPRILDAVAEALELDDQAMEPSWEVLYRHGNMSSPTILYILEELKKRGAPLPWVGLAFGPGLAAEAFLIAE
ncbi:MAG: type III polyketide synthase [Candidatus Sumerlaeia bacterium]|nr:type III polyketide synthase [Candidatus Sumerlaeia bacterium]